MVLIVAYLLAIFFNLQTMRFSLKTCFEWGNSCNHNRKFQPELRRILEKVGRTKFTGLNFFAGNEIENLADKWKNCIDAVCDTAPEFVSCTGALIICERKTKLGEQIDSRNNIELQSFKTAILGKYIFP